MDVLINREIQYTGGLLLIILLICSNRKIYTISSVCSKCFFKHTMQLSHKAPNYQLTVRQIRINYTRTRETLTFILANMYVMCVYPVDNCKQLFLIYQYVISIKSLTRGILNCNYKRSQKKHTYAFP